MFTLGGFPRLCVLSPICNKFLRFTSGAIPVPLLMARMATKPFLIHILVQVLVPLKPSIQCMDIVCSYYLSHAGSVIFSLMFAISECEQSCIEFTRTYLLATLLSSPQLVSAND